MLLPQHFVIAGNSIPTITFFILGAFIVSIFIFWYEGTRDGFDADRLFDLFFLIALLSFVPILFMKFPRIVVYSAFFSALVLAKLLTNKWKWSMYRILDICALVFSINAAFVLLYYLLSSFSALILVPFLLALAFSVCTVLYRRKLTSGVTFGVFVMAFSGISWFFYRGYVDLLFYILSITIGLVTFYYRKKKFMTKFNIASDLLNRLKNKLLSKKARLETGQKKLIEEDPYMQPGRDTSNSEEMDEAILEDLAKEEIEIKKGNLLGMEDQVEKALNKMAEGQYGVCEVCGNPIDKARLEVYPEATKCMDCARKAESTE
ncbi:TraR/DksA C4-type zinc finger protein [Patescibacteria group bacterium]|nr:TraR/DksA C4-type zinc finger protein [Patescibacteria group bacterium]